MEPSRYQVASYICTATRGDKIKQKQTSRPSDNASHYSEEDICQLARKLSRDERPIWSDSPRLYIILRDTAHNLGTSHAQLSGKFIEKEINDTWLPIQSEFLLDCLLPPRARDQFLRVQGRVCSQPVDFQLGFRSPHGHFPSKESPPFSRQRVIGNGHIGKVDEVWSLIDGKLYARKIIRRRLSDFNSASKHHGSFRRELQALRRIDHIHCVKFVGSYTDPRHLAIIMSPVADCNLKQYLQHAETSSDPIVPVRLRKWFGCLATALQYLHSIKIRHRDIKPDNILVHGRRVLLVDFELSLDWKDLAQSTTTADCGKTPLYAAPEVILHKKRNSSSDIWSLGCVFLEMATVIKGRRISDMRELFTSQAENAIFYNNQRGISEWISSLVGSSKVGNAPFSWVSKMLQHDKDYRPRASVIIDLIRDSPTDSKQASCSSLYFGKCCQPDDEITVSAFTPYSTCSRRLETAGLQRDCFCPSTRVYQSHFRRNPQSTSDALTISYLRSSFHPFFMVRHLTRTSMEELTRSLVAEGCWDSIDANVKLFCLPERPLSLNLRWFTPKLQLFYLQKYPASESLRSHESLPVGIYGADPLKLAQSFNEYLNNIVENHLMEQSEFIVRAWENNKSNRVLSVLFRWFQESKEATPDHEVLLMKAAIKVVVINKILGQSPILDEVPGAFENGFSNSSSGPHRFSGEKQSSRLVNRQVKVAFFLLQSTLLEKTLSGLQYLLRVPEARSACLFISMCLSFILERMIVDSREFTKVANEAYGDETATTSDADTFRQQVHNVVFQRIYRLLSLSLRTQQRNLKSSTATKHLVETLNKLRHQFELEGRRDIQPDVQARYPSHLVSALLDLAGHI